MGSTSSSRAPLRGHPQVSRAKVRHPRIACLAQRRKIDTHRGRGLEGPGRSAAIGPLVNGCEQPTAPPPPGLQAVTPVRVEPTSEPTKQPYRQCAQERWRPRGSSPGPCSLAGFNFFNVLTDRASGRAPCRRSIGRTDAGQLRVFRLFFFFVWPRRVPDSPPPSRLRHCTVPPAPKHQSPPTTTTYPFSLSDW